MESELHEKHVKTELGRCSRLVLVLGPVLNGNALEKQKETFVLLKGLSGDLRECLHGFYTPLWRTRSFTADRKISVHLSRCSSKTDSKLRCNTRSDDHCISSVPYDY